MSSAFLAASWIMAAPGAAQAQQAPSPSVASDHGASVSVSDQIQLAQQAPPPPMAPPPAPMVQPPPPPMQAALPPPPPGPPPPPPYMFDFSTMGSAFGTTLKNYGIYLNGGSETNIFGWISGGRKTGVNMQGENTLGADLDMNRIAGIPGAAIHISIDERWGQNPGRFAGAGVLTTANYGPQDTARLGELSWDQDLANDHIRILVGRIADNIDFNTSELYCRFLFSICGNLTNAWYLINNNPSYPVATWGGRVTIKPTLESYFRFGAYQETSVQAANGAGTFFRSFDFGHNVGVFIPAEIGYKTNGAQDPFPRGFYIGGYYDSSRYTTPFGFARTGRGAVYFQMQQMVYRPDPKGDAGITVFGGGLLSTSPDGGAISEQFTAGMSWVGPIAGRPKDQLNFGLTNWQFSRSATQAWRNGCVSDTTYFPGLTTLASRRAACSPFSPTEWQIELNYNYSLAPGISIIPVVAYFINPDGGTSFPGLTIPPTTTHFKNSWVVGAQLAIGLNGAFGLPTFVRTD